MLRFSRFLSHVFHPLLIPSYIFLFLLHSNAYFSYSVRPSTGNLLLIIVFVITFLFPAFSAWIMVRRGIIQSLQMDSRQERINPMLITALYFFACYYFLKKLQVPPLFYVIMFGAACAVIVTLLINFKWKISAHMVAIGGMAGTLFSISHIIYVNYLSVLLIIILLSGLLATARMIAGSHSPLQLYTGFGLGFLIQYLALHYYLF